jgi:uncharacterized membrane protein
MQDKLHILKHQTSIITLLHSTLLLVNQFPKKVLTAEFNMHHLISPPILEYLARILGGIFSPQLYQLIKEMLLDIIMKPIRH